MRPSPLPRQPLARSLGLLEGEVFVLLACHSSPHALDVVRVDARIEAGSRQADVELPLVHEIWAARTIDVDYHAVDGRALARVAGRGIAEINLPGVVEWHRERSAFVEAHLNLSAIELADGCVLAVGDAPVVSGSRHWRRSPTAMVRLFPHPLVVPRSFSKGRLSSQVPWLLSAAGS
jgi:hypothetical protein